MAPLCRKIALFIVTSIKLVTLYFTRNYTGLMFEFDWFPFSIVPCVDHHHHCPDWSKNGECVNNPVTVIETCPKSCGACT